MPSEMFGAATGVQQGIVSQHELALTTLAQGQALMQPDQLANIQAETQLHRAQAQQLMSEADVGHALAQIGSGKTDMHGVAAAYFEKGLPKLGMQAEALAVKMDAEVAQRNAANMRTALAQYKMEKEKLAQASSIWATVKGPQDFEMAKRMLAPTVDPGERQDFMKMQYSPKLVDMLTKQVMSADKQLDIKIKEKDEARKEVDSASLRSYRAVKEKQFDADGARKDERLRMLKKVMGDKGDKPPPPAFTRDLATRITQDYPDMDVKVAQMHADNILAAAKKIRDKNPGLDQKTAVGQAKDAYTKQGGFGKAQLKALGETPDSAKPLPGKFGSYEDRTWYKTDHGPLFYAPDIAPDKKKPFLSQQDLLQLSNSIPDEAGEAGDDESDAGVE